VLLVRHHRQLDQLTSKGLLFSNFVSNGQRSIESLPAILASLPHIFNMPLINSLSEINGFIGIGTIFCNHGYVTSFFHGARTGSMGFDGFAKLAGFDDENNLDRLFLERF